VFWWISSLILTVMMGVLAVISGSVNASPQLHWQGLAALTAWQPLLLGSVIVLTYGSYRLSRYKISSYEVTRYKFSKISLLLRVIRAATLMTLVLMSMLLALVSYYEAEQRGLKHAMRVTALVTIEGLSDSVYDSNLDTGYRQIATLTHIQPLSHDAKQQMARPWLASNPTNDAPTTLNTANANTPLKVLLSAYAYNEGTSDKAADPLAVVNTLLPQQQVWMTLVLSPLAADKQRAQNRVAASGFDSQRWLRTRHIDATAKIIQVSLIRQASTRYEPPKLASGNQTLRWRLRQHFLQDWQQLSEAQRQARAVTLSLLTGDRALITRATKSLYQLAGISHLLAISGTHVLFLAILLAAFVTTLVTKIAASVYVWLPRWQLRWVVMVATAFIYAAFTGFDVPAARTAWMLVAIGLVRLSLVPVRPLKVLLALAVLMAWVDPFVLWQVGYWLSFVAVALLLVYEQGQVSSHQTNPPNPDSPLILRVKQTLITRSWQLIRLQLWLFMALLPLTLLLFGKVSLWGLLINLFAIGLYGMVIVPLNLLAGVCYLLSPSMAAIVWQGVIAIVALTHSLIETIVGWQVLSRQNEAWLYTPVNLGTLLIVSLALLPWLLPKGMLSRWLALPPLSLLVLTMLPAQADVEDATTKVYVLPTTESYLQVVLIKEEQQQAHWLLLADYRSSKQLSYMTLEVERVSERLQQQLGMLGIRRLHGIIVQTPIATAHATTPSLANVATDLAQRLPVGQFWLAGASSSLVPAASTNTISNETASTNTISNQTNNNRAIAPAMPCQAGQRWHTEGAIFNLTALTGWTTVNAASVASCAIAVESAQPIEVYKVSAVNPLAPDLIATTQQDTIETTKRSPISPNNAPVHLDERLPNPQHQLIIDAANRPQLWPLWQLLCPTQASKSALSNPVLLSHSASKIREEQQQQIGASVRINTSTLVQHRSAP